MVRRSLALLVFALLVGAALVSSRAQPPAAAAPDAPVVVSVDVAKLWKHPALAGVKEARGKVEFGWVVHGLVGFTPTDLDHVTVFFTKDAGPFVRVETKAAHDAAVVLESLPRSGGKSGVKALAGGVFDVPGAEFPLALKVSDRVLVFAPAGTDAAELPKLAGVKADAAGRVVSVRVAGDYLAAIPWEGGLQKATALAFTLDIANEKAKAELTLTFASGGEAKAAVPALEAALKDIGKWTAERQKAAEGRPFERGSPGPLLEWIGATLKGVKVKADEARVVAAAEFDLTDAVARLMTAVPDSAFAGGGSVVAGQNNLKQIGLAIHNYHDAFNATPSNSYDKDGKPLLSWRVHILPYIEQDALYKQFKLDEPWDSPHNKPLANVVIKTYVHPGRPFVAGETYYRAFVANKNVKPDYRPWFLEGVSKGPSFAKFSDGLSNTGLVFEAGEGVVWTKPDDLPYDGLMAVPQLGGPSGIFSVLLGDGSVRTLRRAQLGETNLRRIISIADGLVVNFP